MMRLSGSKITVIMKRLFLLTLGLLIALSSIAKRTTIVISLDGCRWDYPEMYDLPFLNALGEQGVQAVMRPSFPSKTFPNHYTIATGLVPDHHGIISNTFYDRESGLTFSLSNPQTKQDPRFWKGEPIWITAKKQGLRTVTVYWPGSDVAIQGMHPDYWQDYEKKPLLSYAARIAELERLASLPEAERPDFIMGYFEEPDGSGHRNGPYSPVTRRTVQDLDALLHSFYQQLQTLKHADSINLIITSDHGMTQLSKERYIELPTILPKEWTERVLYDIPVQIFPKKGYEQRIMERLKGVPHIQVWRKGDVPAYLQYGTNPNIGEIVLLPDLGWWVGASPYRYNGTHGFDPTMSDMQVIFRAVGPDFKKGFTLGHTFQNTEIYGLLCRILHLRPAPNDGRGEAYDLLK